MQHPDGEDLGHQAAYDDPVSPIGLQQLQIRSSRLRTTHVERAQGLGVGLGPRVSAAGVPGVQDLQGVSELCSWGGFGSNKLNRRVPYRRLLHRRWVGSEREQWQGREKPHAATLPPIPRRRWVLHRRPDPG